MKHRESTDELNSYIRFALPLMAKHNIPITPRNYAVWFEYVSGINNELVQTINTMLDKGEEFSEQSNETLYWRFCAEKDEEELRELRKDLQEILLKILGEVTQLSGETEKYESLVSNILPKLSEEASVRDIRNIVHEVLVETKAIGEIGITIQQRLKETTVELERLQEQLDRTKSESLEDFLTGIPNRKAFDETLSMCARMATGDNKDLCLLIIDIDHFKRFNDEYGHIVGDEVLKLVARKVKEIVRGRDFLARYGGEEFVVILPQTKLSGAKSVAENIRRFFERAKLKAVVTSKNLGSITVSVGAARYRPGEPLEGFICRADQALYSAKKAGRNSVATESELGVSG